MRRTTRHMLEDILRDYPDLPKHIKEREEELKYPVLDKDENVGGGRAENRMRDPVSKFVITVHDDRWLNRLKEEYRAIDECLDESGDITVKIINELYFKKQRINMNNLCEEHIIPVSTTKGYELRNEFLESLAKKLDVDVM